VSGKASQDHVDELHSQQAADMASLEAVLSQKADADNVFTQAAAVDMVESKLSNIYTKDAVDLKLAPLATTASVTHLHDSVVTALQSKASEQELSQAVSLLQAQITQIPVNTGSGSSAPVDISGKADISAVYLKGQVDTLLQAKASASDLAAAVAPLARQADVTTQIATAVAASAGSGGSAPPLVLFRAQCSPASGFSWPTPLPWLKADWPASNNYTNIGSFTFDASITNITIPSTGFYEITLHMDAQTNGSYSLCGVAVNNNMLDLPILGSRVANFSGSYFVQLNSGDSVQVRVGGLTLWNGEIVIKKLQ
jgi:hypothetical protein